MNILSRDALKINAAKLINTTPEGFAEYTAWKTSVLVSKDNLFPILQSLLTEIYEPKEQVFIIDLITSFINAYNSSLPLFELQQSLFGISDQIITNVYCVMKVGELISLINRLIYQNENEFILNIDPEKSEMNLLECSVYCSMCHAFDEPRHDATQDKNISIQNFFSEGPLIDYLNFAVRTVTSNPEFSLKLLIACFEFRVKKKFQFNRKSLFRYTPKFMEQLLEKDLFNNIMFILQNAPPEVGADAIKVVMYIASSIASKDYPEIVDGVIRVISFIIDSPAFFNEPVRVSAFGNLMSTTKICTIELIHKLITFFLGLLQHSFIIASNIFEPCLDYYLYFTQTNKDEEIIAHFSSVLQQYVISGLASFESNTEETYSAIFDNRQQTSLTIDSLLLRSHSACADAAVNIGKLLVEIAEKPFTVITNCQMAFLIQIAISAINNFNIFVQLSQQSSYTHENTQPNYLQPLIESVFKVMLMTQDHVLEYNEIIKSENSPFPFEISIAEFIRDYVVKYFSQVPIPIFNTIPLFASESEFVSVAFMRIWTDLLNDIESKDISMVYKTVTNPKIYRYLLETDIPNSMLENFMEYPPKLVIYDTVCMIMSLNPVLKDNFFTLIKTNFPPDTEDDDLLHKLFRVLKGLFLVTKECDAWRELYIFFNDNFASIAFKADPSIHGRAILKLLHTMLSTKFPQQPFRSRTPYQFNLFHFITQMLEKIAQVLVNDLSDLGPPVMPPKLNGCNAISLEEAHVMERNDQIDFDYISIGASGWDIATFIVSTLNKLMISPFPNFGIISFYNDLSHFQIIDMIMEKVEYNSPQRALQLATLEPQLVQEILKFYAACLEFINSNIDDSTNFDRIITFSKAALASNDIQTIQPACKTLLLLLDRLSDSRVVIPHVVLSFEILLNCTQDDALDFVAKVASYNSELIPLIVDQIGENLSEQQCVDFKACYTEAYKEEEDGEERLTLGGKRFKQTNASRLKYFFESAQDMNIHINQFPEFAEYFAFAGPE